MKFKSEIYLPEAIALLDSVNLKTEMLYKLFFAEKRKAQVACFFAPWTSRYVWQAMAIKGAAILNQVRTLSELRQKILECETFDDDMRVVTLETFLQEGRQINA